MSGCLCPQHLSWMWEDFRGTRSTLFFHVMLKRAKAESQNSPPPRPQPQFLFAKLAAGLAEKGPWNPSPQAPES